MVAYVLNDMADKNKLEFFIKTDFSRFTGKYVAIVDDKVVTSGDNAKVVWKDAIKITGKIPTIAKIPKEEALIFVLKWN